MVFLTPHAAKPILVTASSLTILFYGPILGIVLLIIASLYARAVTASKPPTTTRRKQPRRSGKQTSIPAWRVTVGQWQEAGKVPGKRRYQVRSYRDE